jgi:hypothetical protein
LSVDCHLSFPFVPCFVSRLALSKSYAIVVTLAIGNAQFPQSILETRKNPTFYRVFGADFLFPALPKLGFPAASRMIFTISRACCDENSQSRPILVSPSDRAARITDAVLQPRRRETSSVVSIVAMIAIIGFLARRVKIARAESAPDPPRRPCAARSPPSANPLGSCLSAVSARFGRAPGPRANRPAAA